tara:strand:+ start:153 stop:686 length:534 start_codon:yes stop_codon:yes gene_type:complete
MSTLKVNKIIPTAGVPTGGGGGITQVKQTVKTDTASFTVNTGDGYSYTSFSVTITPTSSSSKILLTGFVTCSLSGGEQDVKYFIQRGGSTIDAARGDADGSRSRVSAGNYSNDYVLTSIPINFLDSPATDSAVTYNLAFRHTSGVNRTFYINRMPSSNDNSKYSRGVSVLTAMEVSA